MGRFQFIATTIANVFLVEPTVFGDNRGYFMETYHRGEFKAAGLGMDFVQDNQSKSRQGVLRGMHFQIKNPQGKLVRVLSGEVFDVAVDMRPESPTFGKWYGVVLSAENKKQFYVPERFAHGFLVLSETAEFTYKCTRFYDPSDEGGLAWDDEDVGIEWPIMAGMDVLLSEKDKNNPSFQAYKEMTLGR